MWLYVPSISAQATADSSSPSDSQGSTPELWVTLSGKPTQRPYSWRGWKTRPWIGRLSGTISQPLTAQRGADEWISSLPVSPASRSQRQDSNAVLTMTAGSGLPSHGSSMMWDRVSSSWRTSPDLFGRVSLTSSPILPSSGSMRNGVVSQRQALAPRTGVNGSGLWPTATATDSERRGVPTTIDGQTFSLVHAAQTWPTPTARDGKGKPGKNAQFQNLTTSASTWPTPTATEAKRGDCPSQRARSTPGLATEASLHDLTIMTDGDGGSKRAGLNPCFVEALMGLPIGWTDPERSLTDYISQVTDSSRSARPKRYGNSSGE